MKKEKKSDIPKNSKDVAQVTEDQKNIKITSESTAVLTISERGAFMCRSSNAGTKEQKKKMKRSWCYSKTKKGEWQSRTGEDGTWFPLKPGTKPHDWYEGPKTYNEPKYHECVKRIVLNKEAVQYYISDDACLDKSKKGRAEWAGLTPYERLVRNAEVTAYPGKLTSVKVVN